MPSNKRLQELEDWRETLNLPAGRRVLARLIRTAGALGGSYAPGDAYATAYNEGLRRMGLHILEAIRAAAPEHFAAIITLEEKHHESDQ